MEDEELLVKEAKIIEKQEDNCIKYEKTIVEEEEIF